MNLQSVLDLTNYIYNKEQMGNSITPAQYNTLLPSVNWELYNHEASKIVQGSLTPIAGDIIAASFLNPFKESTTIVPVGSSATAPADYVRFLSFGTIYGGGYRDVTPVSESQYSKIQQNVYSRPDLHPVVKIGDRVFSLLPFDITTLSLDYLRTPVTPYYDYVVNYLGNPIYLETGNSVELANLALQTFDVYANEYSNSLGDDPIYTDVTYSQPAVANAMYRARTVELEWEQRAYDEFVLRLLSRVSVNLSAEQIGKYAEEKMKSDVEV